jgi:hypothetical protein
MEEFRSMFRYPAFATERLQFHRDVLLQRTGLSDVSQSVFDAVDAAA